ncbi:hypothetical protein [Allokutzneria sp. NRRL B-24872]|uniref:hypothetical protein n=1 Tax=Allokutzneria sp. NRRL B-24872 TaxID=1137961 RepID=UPI0011782335|nr:hypothetical protein [Allokutzneria sp. NRRL B-24872]
MRRRTVAGALAASAAAAMLLGSASSASAAGEMKLLASASKGGVTAKLWLNTRTRVLHGEARNLRKGEMVRMDRNYGIAGKWVAQSAVASLNTTGFRGSGDFSVCAGSPVGGARFVCTKYYDFNG